MNDAIISVIRTVVPAAVASVLAWAAGKVGFNGPLPDVSEFAVVVVLFLYYGVVRAIESKVPWFGIFLGWPKPPVYTDPPKSARS